MTENLKSKTNLTSLKKRCVMKGELSLCAVLLGCTAVLKREIHCNIFGREFSCSMIQPLKHLFNYPI